MTKRARLIVNPWSRTLPSHDRLATAPAWLRLHDWQVDVVRTDGPLHATELARNAAREGYDAVIAAGGDGTVNEVVNGIAGSETALAVIPGGTANVWAREVGSPRHPGSVAAMLEHGQRRRIDLGIAGDRYFLLMASFGLDSAVAASVSSYAKAHFGRVAYVARGLREATRYSGVQAEITADGETWRIPLLLGLLGNTRSYGGLISVSHRARANDGLLDMVLYRAGGILGFGRQLARTLVQQHESGLGTVYREVRDVTVRTDPVVPVQADGEVIGQTPMRFTIDPLALTVIVPEGRAPAIFGES
jgi:YegS/Rv2252/BmrU family lipid kinase